MKAAIRTYKFDFKTEVGDLMATFPFLHDHVLFVQSNMPQVKTRRKPKPDDFQFIGNPVFTLIEKAPRDIITHLYSQDPSHSSLTYPLALKKNKNISFVSIRKKEEMTESFGPKNRQFMRFFTLNHETGHALIERGFEADKKSARGEGIADAFAAIRCFQRFGRNAQEMLTSISWFRSLAALMGGDIQHLTTTILDKIIADSRHTDFSKLPPDETLRLARKYAEEWGPKPSELSILKKDYWKCRRHGEFDHGRLVKTCLATSHRFSFYIGTRFFQPFMHPDGIILDGRSDRLDAHTSRKLQARFTACARKQQFRTLFNENAARPRTAKKPAMSLAEHLKITRPRKKMSVKI